MQEDIGTWYKDSKLYAKQKPFSAMKTFFMVFFGLCKL
jgi:hypothetical protein